MPHRALRSSPGVFENQTGADPPPVADTHCVDSASAAMNDDDISSLEHGASEDELPLWGDRYLEKQAAAPVCGRHALHNLMGKPMFRRRDQASGVDGNCPYEAHIKP